MGSYNYLTQKLIKLAGAYIQVGKLTFTTTGLTVEVPTKIRSRIICGFGVTEDGQCVSQDATITSSAVTFSRPNDGKSGATFNYFLVGY